MDEKVYVLVRNIETDEVALMGFQVDEAVDIRMLKAAGFVPAESWESARRRLAAQQQPERTGPRGIPVASAFLRMG